MGPGVVSFLQALRFSLVSMNRALLTLALLAAWCLIHGRYPVHLGANRRQLRQMAAQGIVETIPNLFDVNKF